MDNADTELSNALKARFAKTWKEWEEKLPPSNPDGVYSVSELSAGTAIQSSVGELEWIESQPQDQANGDSTAS